MKTLYKFISFVIIASFIFTGEVFAAKRMHREDRTEQRTTRRMPKAPKETRQSRTAQTKKAKTARTRLKHADTKKTSRAQTRVAKKQKAAPVKKERTVKTRKAVAQKQKPAAAPKAMKRSTKVVKKQTQIVEQKQQPVAPKTTKKSVKPAKKVQPTPDVQPKKTPSKAPSHYTLRSSDLTEDLKNDLKLLFLKKGESLEGSLKVTAAEIREGLAELQLMENNAPGITQEARGYLVSRGYNPGNGGLVSVVPSSISERLQYYVSAFILEEGEPLLPAYILPEAKATKMLNKMQERENRAPGMTQRVRDFLRTKYGFQG